MRDQTGNQHASTPPEKRRSVRVVCNLTPDDAHSLGKCAERQGLSTSNLLRSLALQTIRNQPKEATSE